MQSASTVGSHASRFIGHFGVAAAAGGDEETRCSASRLKLPDHVEPASPVTTRTASSWTACNVSAETVASDMLHIRRASSAAAPRFAIDVGFANIV